MAAKETRDPLDLMMAPAAFWRNWGRMASVAMVSAGRRRNAVWDAMIYDVARLSDAERRRLRARPVSGGALIVAYPHGAHAFGLYDRVADWAVSNDALTRVAVVAGCGGEPLGAAAMARAAADALREPAVAIAPDYDVADMVEEATGAAFAPFGAAPVRAWAAAMAEGFGAPKQTRRAVAALRALLDDPRGAVRLWIVHGRGAAALSEALTDQIAAHAREAGPAPDYDRVIVALGASDPFPEGYQVVRIPAPALGGTAGSGLAAAFGAPVNAKMFGALDVAAALAPYRGAAARETPPTDSTPSVATVSD